MARSRFDNLNEEEQETILREAGEEFADKGYESASLNAIIEKAGISKGSLYYYFENKEDLFATVVERATARLISHVANFSLEDLTEETFWPELERVVHELATAATDHTWYFRLARTFYRMQDARSGSVRESKLFDVTREWTERLIERGQQLGVVRTDLPRPYAVELCLAVAEAGDRWFLAHFEEYDDEDFQREAERQVDVFRRLLEPREQAESHSP
ncbi:MAG: TetR/AcrR family transcriptional regulator [Bradymonadaceae bacterium]